MGLLQDLFRTHGPAYLERFGPAMPKAHRKVIAAITDCHTEAAGSALYVCDGCGQRHVVHRACGNRHCPCCQQGKGHEWLGGPDPRDAPSAPAHRDRSVGSEAPALRPGSTTLMGRYPLGLPITSAMSHRDSPAGSAVVTPRA